tara:strand:- start:2144 stop:3022 length:879 start_codon:yes stop_codon:yes gene_type:complete
MGSHHHHHHSHSSAGKNLLLAFVLNFIFCIVEFIGGYLTNSIAITSDALHDLGDSIALLFAYFSEKLSLKHPDKKFTYGYRRFSVISALINGFILLVGSSYIIYESVLRIGDPEPVAPQGMLALGILGVVVNGYAAFKLSKGDGLNQKMVMYHLLEDLMGWGAVIIVSIVLHFYPWYFLDSILSILISLIILKGVYKNFLKVGSILLQKFPHDLEMEKIVAAVMKLEHVVDLHAVRGWSIDDLNHTLSFHVVVPNNTMIEQLDVLKARIKKLLTQHNVKYSSIEFEGEKYKC